MHDPMTVAFEIKYPWRAHPELKDSTKPIDQFLKTYRNPFITIWHVDPQKRRKGVHTRSDDTCDWFGSHRRLSPREEALSRAIDELKHTLGFAPYYPDPKLYGPDYMSMDAWTAESRIGPIGELQRAHGDWKARHGFRWHPRWHIHHWKMQIHPLQDLKRWLFSRCRDCGGRFAWGETGWTNQWDSGGPRWFRSERDLHHMNCGGQRGPMTEQVDNRFVASQ